MSELTSSHGHFLRTPKSRKYLCGWAVGIPDGRPAGVRCGACVRIAGKLLTPKQRSPLELEAERLIAAAGLPEPVREYAFAEAIGRRWRFDFAWPDRRVALEIDGMLWGGGHTSGDGRRDDMVKDAYAAICGWKVLRVDRDLLRQGYAAKWLRCAFSGFPIGDVMGFVAPMFPTAAVLDPKRHARKLQRDRAKRAEARA